MLYPLKFKPIFKDKIWGGNKIKTVLGQDFSPLPNCGEAWTISGIDPDSSIVANGFLKGNTLNELIEIYMGDLVGEKVFDSFGEEFPLLIKFIDAGKDLSVQVHPDDKLAGKKHNCKGKTEMWYVIDADENSKLNIGFNRPMNKELLQKHLANNTLEEILHFADVQSGDAVFIPSGKVHAICGGILLAEIQQSSDITYRLYDYNRKDENNKPRQLHINDAIEAINYQDTQNGFISYSKEKNTTNNIVSNQFFTTNFMDFNKSVEKIYVSIDSFVIYICLSGSAKIICNESEETIRVGECVMIPASIESAIIHPEKQCKLLECYI